MFSFQCTDVWNVRILSEIDRKSEFSCALLLASAPKIQYQSGPNPEFNRLVHCCAQNRKRIPSSGMLGPSGPWRMPSRWKVSIKTELRISSSSLEMVSHMTIMCMMMKFHQMLSKSGPCCRRIWISGGSSLKIHFSLGCPLVMPSPGEPTVLLRLKCCVEDPVIQEKMNEIF